MSLMYNLFLSQYSTASLWFHFTSLHLRFRNLHFISLHFTKDIIAHQLSSLHFTYISSGLYLIHFTSLKKSSEFQPLEIRADPSTELNMCTQDLSQGNTRSALSAFRLNRAFLLVASNQRAFDEEDNRLPDWARSTRRKGDSPSSQSYYEEPKANHLFFEWTLSQDILLSTIKTMLT